MFAPLSRPHSTASFGSGSQQWVATIPVERGQYPPRASLPAGGFMYRFQICPIWLYPPVQTTPISISSIEDGLLRRNGARLACAVEVAARDAPLAMAVPIKERRFKIVSSLLSQKYMYDLPHSIFNVSVRSGNITDARRNGTEHLRPQQDDCLKGRRTDLSPLFVPPQELVPTMTYVFGSALSHTYVKVGIIASGAGGRHPNALCVCIRLYFLHQHSASILETSSNKSIK